MSDSKAEMHQIRLQRSPYPVAGLRGPTSNGRERERGGEGNGRRGKEGRGVPHFCRKKGKGSPYSITDYLA